MSVKSFLTKDFEDVSYHLLTSFLPASAIVKKFGDNSDYAGNTQEKIQNLANDMNIDCNESLIESIVSRANKEKGLDLIGWIPFNDGKPNMFTILGQCACGKEWYKKLDETRVYERIFKFYLCKPMHVFFLPYTLVNHSIEFHQTDQITLENIFFDRKRIVEIIGIEDISEPFESMKVVEKCIEFVEDIV